MWFDLGPSHSNTLEGWGSPGLVLEHLLSPPTSVSSPSSQGQGAGRSRKEGRVSVAGRHPWSYCDSANSICCWCNIHQCGDICKHASGFLEAEVEFHSGSSNTEGAERNSCIFFQLWDFHTPTPFSRSIPPASEAISHLTVLAFALFEIFSLPLKAQGAAEMSFQTLQV